MAEEAGGKKFDDIPTFDSWAKPIMEMEGPSAAGLEALDKPEAAAVDEEAAVPDEPSAKRVSMSSARAEMRKRREKRVGHMQYAARVLSRSKSCLLFDGKEFMSRPLELRFEQDP